MDELTIEQKAKRYDKALERAKRKFSEKELNYLFPELQCEDERIIKALINGFKDYKGWDEEWFDGITVREAIVWLEKQGEIDKTSYEIAEKEKREFVGDGFIKCYADFQDFKEGETYWLEYVGSDNYNVRSDNLLGKMYHITPCQLYTIFKKQTWLEKQGEQKSTDNVEPKFKVGEWITNGEYTWKIVEVKPLDYILQSQDGNIVDDTISYVDEQFHSFTIEDAKDGDLLFYRGNVNYSDGIKFDRILLFENLDKSFFVLTKYSNGVEDYGVDVNIDYPNNIVPATKEQKEILFMAMTDAGYIFDFEKKELKKLEKNDADEYIETTDAIKEQANLLLKLVPKQEWSEEDKHKVKDIIYFLDTAKKHYASTVEIDACIDWLKSIEQRIGG